MVNQAFTTVAAGKSGVGHELAKLCSRNGFDLIVVADHARTPNAAETVPGSGGQVEEMEADLATDEGVDLLYEKVLRSRWPAAVQFANARRGVGPSPIRVSVVRTGPRHKVRPPP